MIAVIAWLAVGGTLAASAEARSAPPALEASPDATL
jgi:hypothetical protein